MFILASSKDTGERSDVCSYKGIFSCTEFEFFIRSIPYNLYALTALCLVVLIIFTKRDFGPMKVAEDLAKTGELYDVNKYS